MNPYSKNPVHCRTLPHLRLYDRSALGSYCSVDLDKDAMANGSSRNAGMPMFQLSPAQSASIVAYILSLKADE